MSMIFHLVECLNHLGLKVKIEGIVGSNEIIDNSFLLNGVDFNKITKNKNYLKELKVDLKKKYFENRDALAKSKVDGLLTCIWSQVGISMTDDAIYPFRNAMITEFINEQNLIYDEVIDDLCRFLNGTKISSSNMSTSMDAIRMLLLPSLFLCASMKHGGKGSEKCTGAEKILMKQLSIMTKLAADALKKRAKN